MIYASTNSIFSISPITLSDCTSYQIINSNDSQLRINNYKGIITGYYTKPTLLHVQITCSNERLDYKTNFTLIIEDNSLHSSFPSGILVNYINKPLNSGSNCLFPQYSILSHPIHYKTIISEMSNIRKGNNNIYTSLISTYDMNMLLTDNQLISFKLESFNSVRMYINTFDDIFMEYEGCGYNIMEKSIQLSKESIYIHIDYIGDKNSELLNLYYRMDNDNSYRLVNNTIISTNSLSFMIKYPNNNNIMLMNNTYINIHPIVIGLGYIKDYQISPELPNGLYLDKENGTIQGIVMDNNNEIRNNDYTITINGLNCIITTTKIRIIYQSIENIEISSIKTVYSKDHMLYWYYYDLSDENIIAQNYNNILEYNNNNQLDINTPTYLETPIIIQYNTILINNDLKTLRLYGNFEYFSFYIDESHSYTSNHGTKDYLLNLDDNIQYYYVNIMIISYVDELDSIKCIFNGNIDCDNYFIKSNSNNSLLYSNKYVTLLYNQSVTIIPRNIVDGNYSINAKLPIGLTFNNTNGIINGTVLAKNYNNTKNIYNHYEEFIITNNNNNNNTFSMYLQLHMISKPYLLLYLNKTDSNKPSFFIFETYSNISIDKLDYNYGFIQNCTITPFLPAGIYFGKRCEILGIPKFVLDYYNFTVTASNIMGEIQQNVSFVIDRCKHGLTVNIEISDFKNDMILNTRILNNGSSNSSLYNEYFFQSTKSYNSVDYCIDDGDSTFIFDFIENPYKISSTKYFPVSVKISFKGLFNVTEFPLDPSIRNTRHIEKIIYIYNPPYMLRYNYEFYTYEYGINSPNNFPLYYNTINNWTISGKLPNNLTFNYKNGFIEGRVAEIVSKRCYSITGCNDIMCIKTEICLEILAHFCYENDHFFSTLVNHVAYRQCENGYFGYKSEMCIFNEYNYTSVPEWDEDSWLENCYLVKHEPYFAYETVVLVSFETTVDSYFFSDRFKGRINFFELLNSKNYFINETSFIATENGNNSITTKILFQFTCKEEDYYELKELIISTFSEKSFLDKYVGTTDGFILNNTVNFYPHFYHSIYYKISKVLVIIFSILSVISIIFLLHLCKKANRLSSRKKNRYDINYYIPFTDEDNNINNNKNKKKSKNVKMFVNTTTKKLNYI